MPRAAESAAYQQTLQQTVTAAYDALGRQTTQVDALGHTTTMSYDAVGRLRTVTSPVGGVET